MYCGGLKDIVLVAGVGSLIAILITSIICLKNARRPKDNE